MPNIVRWNSNYGTGNEILDHQHQDILAKCNTLADFISDSGPENDQQFQNIFNEIMTLVREHFATEEALLTRCGYPLIEEHMSEHDDFEYLAADIMTRENFEKAELQEFLALWWVGHIVDSGKKYRAALERK
ncbi:MAG: bacteriohemerythrin [Rhodocyclaceae bacterium]|nr:bacteriohemerythrin [Rhodocyclaceae bacterium]